MHALLLVALIESATAQGAAYRARSCKTSWLNARRGRARESATQIPNSSAAVALSRVACVIRRPNPGGDRAAGRFVTFWSKLWRRVSLGSSTSPPCLSERLSRSLARWSRPVQTHSSSPP
eukprot:717714-Prymnesium_polylepis.1